MLIGFEKRIVFQIGFNKLLVKLNRHLIGLFLTFCPPKTSPKLPECLPEIPKINSPNLPKTSQNLHTNFQKLHKSVQKNKVCFGGVARLLFYVSFGFVCVVFHQFMLCV